jgi:hypothetical protein
MYRFLLGVVECALVVFIGSANGMQYEHTDSDKNNSIALRSESLDSERIHNENVMSLAIITLAFQMIRTDTDDQRTQIRSQDIVEFISLALESDRLDPLETRQKGSVNENANVPQDEHTVVKLLNSAITRLFETHSLPACLAPAGDPNKLESYLLPLDSI